MHLNYRLDPQGLSNTRQKNCELGLKNLIHSLENAGKKPSLVQIFQQYYL